MKEVWRNIEEFKGLYQISNLGRVKSIDRMITYRTGIKRFTRGKILTVSKNKLGYPQITLSKNDKEHSRRIHRLVAQAFLPNPNNYKEVNHIDGNKSNNVVTNLEWCDRSHNMRHAIKMGLKKSRKGIPYKIFTNK